MNDVSNKDIYELLQTVIKKSDNIENQIKVNREEFKQDIHIIYSEIKNEIDTLKQANEGLREENKKLKDRLLNTERKLRKFNLVIYGLREEENKIAEIKVLMHLINDKLNVDCRYTDIRDLHRIGKRTDEKNRPTIVEFINYQQKLEILANAKKLKGTGIIISNDYIPEDYQQRKVLRANLKIAREKKIDAYIKNNELVINGEIYTCDELKEQPYIPVEEEQAEGDNKTANNSELPTQQTSPKNITRKRKEQPTETESLIKRSNRLKNK